SVTAGYTPVFGQLHSPQLKHHAGELCAFVAPSYQHTVRSRSQLIKETSVGRSDTKSFEVQD
ncbi:unnamed protein product, partial [Hermetia illucens]